MSGCPSSSQLNIYAGGGLTSEERQELESHFDSCPACYNTIVDREIENVLPVTPEEAPHQVQAPGRVLGHYRLVRELGRGGQARVYLAEDTRLPRKVALKLFPASFASSRDALVRFEREAAALSRLDHPGICAIHEVGEVDGCPFLAMRYVEGQTLGEKIARLAELKASAGTVDRVTLLETLQLIERTARALHVAHEAGLIHRDIKPSNIMITPDDQPVILDFGLVKDGGDTNRTLTRTGDVTGTPAYMSPEQILGGRACVDRRSDVFSLGISLYEALTLRLPFDAPTAPGVFKEILTGAVPDPSRSNSHISRDLCVILQTALDRDPQRRYQTALAFAEDLRRFRCHETILARPAGPGLRVRRWTQRNPQVALSLAAAFLILAAALGTAVVFLDKVRRESAARAVLLRKEEGLRLAFQSAAVLRENPGQALRLAVEAARRAPSFAASSALLGALESCRERARLLGHSSSVGQAAFSPDGALVATASVDRTARVWNARTGEVVAVAEGHGAAVRAVEFSPDGKRILTASADATARIWEAESGKELLQLKGDDEPLKAARFSPDGATILTLSAGSARLWETSTGRLLHPLNGHSKPLHCARFSPDGLLVATGSEDKSVLIWNASSGQLLKRLDDHTAGVYDVGWSGDATLLIAGCADGAVRVWNTLEGSLLSNLIGHSLGIHRVALTPDGTRAATGGEDFTARIWDVKTGQELFVLPHDHKVVSCEISRDGRQLLTASYDRMGRVWSMNNGELLTTFRGQATPLLHASFSADGTEVVTSAVDSVVRVWSVTSPQPVPVIPPQLEGRFVLSLDPKGNHVASARLNSSGEVKILAARSGALEKTLMGHAGAITSINFGSEGTRLLTTSQDATARVWDVEGGQPVCELRGHKGAVTTGRFSSDDRQIITASEDNSVWIWDAKTGAGHPLAESLPAPALSASFSPDGTRACFAMFDGQIRILDLRGGTLLLELREQINPASIAEWSPDSTRLITGSPTLRAQIREAASGKVIGALVHPSRTAAARYSPDGRRIVTLCEDRTVRVWNAERQELELQFNQDGCVTPAVWFDLEAPSIVVHFVRMEVGVAKDCLLLRYRLDLLDEALKYQPGTLTPEEWDLFEIGSSEERAVYREDWLRRGTKLGVQKTAAR